MLAAPDAGPERPVWCLWCRCVEYTGRTGVSTVDEDIPTKHALSNSTPTSTPTTPAPAQAIDGAITRSRAKKLQQEVNALLCESYINVNENIILPKYSTLVVLRYTHEEGGDRIGTTRCRMDQLKEG